MDEAPVRSARKIASFANCTATDVDKLATCLRAVPAQTVLAAHNQYLVSREGITRPRYFPSRDDLELGASRCMSRRCSGTALPNTRGPVIVVLWVQRAPNRQFQYSRASTTSAPPHCEV